MNKTNQHKPLKPYLAFHQEIPVNNTKTPLSYYQETQSLAKLPGGITANIRTWLNLLEQECYSQEVHFSHFHIIHIVLNSEKQRRAYLASY